MDEQTIGDIIVWFIAGLGALLLLLAFWRHNANCTTQRRLDRMVRLQQAIQADQSIDPNDFVAIDYIGMRYRTKHGWTHVDG